MDGERESRLDPWDVVCERNAKLWRDHIAAHPWPRASHATCSKQRVELKHIEKITGYSAVVSLCELCDKERLLGTEEPSTAPRFRVLPGGGGGDACA